MEIDHLYSPAQLDFLEVFGASTRRLNQAGRLAVVLMKKPVARGDLSIDGVGCLHARLGTLLGERGIYLDAGFHGSHHPLVPLERFVVNCHCRKQDSGMPLHAADEIHLTLEASVLASDNTPNVVRDRAPGARRNDLAELRLDLLSDAGLLADYRCRNLAGAAAWIRAKLH